MSSNTQRKQAPKPNQASQRKGEDTQSLKEQAQSAQIGADRNPLSDVVDKIPNAEHKNTAIHQHKCPVFHAQQLTPEEAIVRILDTLEVPAQVSLLKQIVGKKMNQFHEKRDWHTKGAQFYQNVSNDLTAALGHISSGKMVNNEGF